MSQPNSAEPLTPAALQTALAKSVGIVIFVFTLLAALTLPSMIAGGADAATIFSIVIQLIMTTLCVGGWFVLFLGFDKHLGDGAGDH